MNKLSRLLQQKPKKEETPQTNITTQEISIDSTTYRNRGKSDCRDASGSPEVLKNCLEEIYTHYTKSIANDKELQENMKRPLREEIGSKQTELEKNITLQEIKENAIQENDNKVKDLEFKITDAPLNPEKYNIDASKKPKAQFYIGLAILIPITLYLFVFYVSASYSAFFKDFTPDITVFAAIFDGQALSKAYNDDGGGLLEVIFICTIPFAFMGLGYLIHMFQKNKNKTKAGIRITGLLLTTLIFDMILAYQIESKIFDFNKLPGEVFSIQLAVQSVQFWGIIFAGFIVYLIWGFVFDFIMKEHENIDKVKVFIKTQKDQIKNIELETKQLKNERDNIKENISSLKGNIEELVNRLSSIFIPHGEYRKYHFEYLTAWQLTLSSEIAMSNEQKENRLQECTKISEEHLNKYDPQREKEDMPLNISNN